MNHTDTNRALGAFEAVLDRLRDESPQLFGAPSLSVEPVRRLKRPFSQVMEVHVGANGPPSRVFIKILNPRSPHAEEVEATRRNAAREFDTLRKVHAGLTTHPDLSTPRPIACYPELFALVTEGVEGESLDRVLSGLRGAPSLHTMEAVTNMMRRVGAWLSAFQAIDTSLAPVSLDRLRVYLDARLHPLADTGVITGGVRAGLLRYFDNLAGEIAETDLVAIPVHADFTPENVIVAPDRVTVLDFTMAKHGVQFLDLAHMFMQIEMLKARPWFRSAVLNRTLTALLAGFNPAVRPERPLFQLLLLQHVVCYLRQPVEPQRFPARLLSGHVRRRHLTWLAARASAS